LQLEVNDGSCVHVRLQLLRLSYWRCWYVSWNWGLRVKVNSKQ